MSQYKAAMDRLYGDGSCTRPKVPSEVGTLDFPSVESSHESGGNVAIETIEISSSGSVHVDVLIHHQGNLDEARRKRGGATPWLKKILDEYVVNPFCNLLTIIQENKIAVADYTLKIVLPVVWVLLFLFIIKDPVRDLLPTLHLPFIGAIASVISNSLPIGNGIVYLPLLVKIVEHDDIHLSIEYTMAVMSISNGVVGALQWIRRDHEMIVATKQTQSPNEGDGSSSSNSSIRRLIIWESFGYTILPSWMGAVIGLLAEPELDSRSISLLFSALCFALSLFVLRLILSGQSVHSNSNEDISLTETASRSISGNEIDDSKCDMEENESLLEFEDKSSTAYSVSEFRQYEDSSSPFLEKVINRIEYLGHHISHKITPVLNIVANKFSVGQKETANNIDVVSEPAEIIINEKDTHSNNKNDMNSSVMELSTLTWYRLVFVSFMGGLVFGSNLGMGPSLLTFICLQILGYPAQACMVTSIITGGINCWAPFFIHAAVLHNIPSHVWTMWIMTLPGTFVGAYFAPKLREFVGQSRMLAVFGVICFTTSIAFLF